MTLQIYAIIFIGLWAFFGYWDYRDNGNILASVFGGVLGAMACSLVIVVAAILASISLGY